MKIHILFILPFSHVSGFRRHNSGVAAAPHMYKSNSRSVMRYYHRAYLNACEHLAPCCCGPVCHPLLLRCRPTPRWAGHSDWCSLWNRSTPGRRSVSWCRATFPTVPGGPPPWWASPWSAPTPWRLTWRERRADGGAREPRARSGEGRWRTSGQGVTGRLLGGAGVGADSRICSLDAAHLHWSKVVGCNRAYNAWKIWPEVWTEVEQLELKDPLRIYCSLRFCFLLFVFSFTDVVFALLVQIRSWCGKVGPQLWRKIWLNI